MISEKKARESFNQLLPVIQDLHVPTPEAWAAFHGCAEPKKVLYHRLPFSFHDQLAEFAISLAGRELHFPDEEARMRKGHQEIIDRFHGALFKKGWLTTDEVGDAINKRRETALMSLRRLEEEGLVVSRKGKSLRRGGVPVEWHWASTLVTYGKNEDDAN